MKKFPFLKLDLDLPYEEEHEVQHELKAFFKSLLGDDDGGRGRGGDRDEDGGRGRGGDRDDDGGRGHDRHELPEYEGDAEPSAREVVKYIMHTIRHDAKGEGDGDGPRHDSDRFVFVPDRGDGPGHEPGEMVPGPREIAPTAEFSGDEIDFSDLLAEAFGGMYDGDIY